LSTDYAAYLKEWKRRNPEKVKEYARRYSKKHSKALAVKSLAWKQKNIERARMQDKERQRAVRRENPELTAARRAADDGLGGRGGGRRLNRPHPPPAPGRNATPPRD